MPVILIAGFFGLSNPVFATPVNDVPGSHWAKEDVEQVVGKGVLQVDEDGNFKGNRNVRRYELAAALARMQKELDEERKRDAAREKDLASMRRLMKDLASELKTTRQERDELAAKLADTEKRWEEGSATTTKRIDKIEKDKISKEKMPLEIHGDFRIRHQHTTLRDQTGSKGSSSNNVNRARLIFKYNLDPTSSLTFRWRSDQPVRRGGDADGVSTFRMDIAYYDKLGFLGGNLRAGRQKYRHGLGMVFLGYFDGIKYERDLGKYLHVMGTVHSEYNAQASKKTHGLNANMMSLEYSPVPNLSILASTFSNNAEFDKYGVLEPRTKEGWISLDVKGNDKGKLEYFGSIAAYRNQLNGGNTKPAQRHLRGDTENLAFITGAFYNHSKKLRLGGLFSSYQDNYRPMISYSDFYYFGFGEQDRFPGTTNYLPIEEACNALALSANNPRTNQSEGVVPPASDAGGAAIPFARSGESRATGGYLADIHGYKDYQVNAMYRFSDRVSAKVIADWLRPGKAAYNYRDVNSLALRLLYNYSKKSALEFRGMRVRSGYGRSASDFRTEWYIKY